MPSNNPLDQPISFPVKNWVEPPTPPTTDMVGQYCSVVQLNHDVHAKALFDAFARDADNRNWTYLPYGPFPEFESFQSWLSDISKQSDPLFHAVIDPKSGAAIGLASYLRITPVQGVIEVGHIHFSPSLQRTPMATEVMFLMMQRVFDECGYRRYEWKCDALNEKSNSAALRLGFSFEGIFRQAVMYKGRNRDTAWYSIIDSEWPRLKQAYVAWLDPANFDSNGLQIKSLRDMLSTQTKT